MSQENIHIDTRLDSPDLPETHDLHAVLGAALRSRSDFQPSVAVTDEPFWPATHFGLDRARLYLQSTENEKLRILQNCGDSLLAEAYYIEKCGIYFAAKMALVAETAQERMLYSMIGADEATHFSWVAGFANQDAVARHLRDPFIQLLDEVLQREDRATLSYIVQVILEGWGINHYRALARDCQNKELKRVFENIIRDEALHHRSGVVLFNEQNLSDEQVGNITNILASILLMVQCGPQMVVSQVERVKGPLAKEEKERLFEELDCETQTAKRLDLIKSLICSAAGFETILSELARRDCLRPLTASECAQASADLRP